MKRAATIIVGLIVAVGIGGYVVKNYYWDSAVKYGSRAINYVKYMSAPKGTLTTEMASNYQAPNSGTAANVAVNNSGANANAANAGKNWPSYNGALTSVRYSPLDQITPQNADNLKVKCTFDTGEYTGFNSGILEVNGALLFATEHNLYSIDPETCKLNWKAHENYTPATPQAVNRGPAYMDGKIFRGTQDGRVLAYDFKTGNKLWQTTIANYKKGESIPSAPIAWNGMVFAGNAGGDIKGVKGRMYGIDANTGKVKWEFYLVPKSPNDPTYGPEAKSPLTGKTWDEKDGEPITGGGTWTSYTIDPATGLLYVPGGNPAPDFADNLRKGKNLYSGSVVVLDAMTGEYKTDYKIVPKDWHDWDVSAAPAIIKTAAGKKIMAVAPKDGHLYGFNLANHDEVFSLPVTKMLNTEAAFKTGKPVRFCPGSTGGAEWNGPAYDEKNNLIMVGEIQRCTTVTRAPAKSVVNQKNGTPWSANDTSNPFDTWGTPDPTFDWAGWVYAVNADSGQWKWRAKSNYPVQSGVTPTAGGIVSFGDMGGNFYVLNANTGKELWGKKIGGAIGGGVIAYDAGHGERMAVASGLTEVLWPTEITTAKVSVLGLS